MSEWDSETDYAQNTLVEHFDPDAVGEDLPKASPSTPGTVSLPTPRPGSILLQRHLTSVGWD